jgi:hypothetical protein
MVKITYHVSPSFGGRSFHYAFHVAEREYAKRIAYFRRQRATVVISLTKWDNHDATVLREIALTNGE